MPRPTRLLNEIAYSNEHNPLVSALLIALDHADEFQMDFDREAIQVIIPLIPHWNNTLNEGYDRINILHSVDQLISDLIEIRHVVKSMLYDYKYIWEGIKCTCGAGFVPWPKHDTSCPWRYLVSDKDPETGEATTRLKWRVDRQTLDDDKHIVFISHEDGRKFCLIRDWTEKSSNDVLFEAIGLARWIFDGHGQRENFPDWTIQEMV